MSPNPRREKGLSHRASGEEFSRGTFRTIGSLERKRHNPYEKLSSLHTDTRTCSCCTGPKGYTDIAKHLFFFLKKHYTSHY